MIPIQEINPMPQLVSFVVSAVIIAFALYAGYKAYKSIENWDIN